MIRDMRSEKQPQNAAKYMKIHVAKCESWTLSMQQKAPTLVIQINYTLPASTPGICSNASICQGGHFRGTSHILPTYTV